MRIEIKSPIATRANLNLNVPGSFTVRRLKEIISHVHPEYPSVFKQVLLHKGTPLINNSVLESTLEDEAVVQMTFKPVPNPNNLTAAQKLETDIFLDREKEYMERYRFRMGQLTGRQRPFDSEEAFSYLPIMHPQFQERLRIQQGLEQEVQRIRLQPITFWHYFLTFYIVLILAFLVLLYFSTESLQVVGIYGALSLVLYIGLIRFKIEQHRREQMIMLPREYLEQILPHMYPNQQQMDALQIGVFCRVWETVRAFFFSLLPWYHNEDYVQGREAAIQQ